jgi:hypothetical protein
MRGASRVKRPLQWIISWERFRRNQSFSDEAFLAARRRRLETMLGYGLATVVQTTGFDYARHI